MRRLTLLVCLLAMIFGLSRQPSKAAATASEANPFSAVAKSAYLAQKAVLLRSAEKMPGENYKL